ncbi:MAG: DinB family protein [Hydrogenibacillus schlegelii]|uniref:DinB family protein n=1 Tax=Hydrogenibacillus schlegelii TaxID=1484 RepID=A0A947GBY4_HYDSH|nr:DinB family protein [Hydrogenibacillus schlegelii]
MGIETLPFYVSNEPFASPEVPASWKGEQVAKRWLMHREAVIALAEKLPEHTAHWRPWANGFTTLQLLHHIAWATDFFLSAIEGRERHNVEMPSSVQEAVRMLADLKERQAASIAGYTEDILGKVVEISVLGVKEPAVDILHRMIYHEAHHKGQLWVYARMMGIEPPFYVA